jgi:hypothetical protein
MVRRSTDVLNGLQQAVDPRRERLKQIQARWAEFPGSGPRGTGSTGLASSDFAGWARQQNENFEGQNLERELAGLSPMQHRFGGEISVDSEMPSTMWDPARQTSAVPGTQWAPRKKKVV